MSSRWLGWLLLAAAIACGGEGDDGQNGSLLPGTPGGLTGGGVTGGGTPGGLGDAGNPVTVPPTPGGGTLGGASTGGITGAGTAGGTAGGGALALPCDVQKILKDKCQTCHSNPPTGAAPYPLVTLADLFAASPVKPAEKVWQRVKARTNETGQTSMPPPARPQLTAQEKATLNAFLNGGAVGVPASAAASCAPTTGGMTGATGGTMGGPGGTMGGDPKCDVTMELRAHGGQSATDTTPFTAPTGGDHYEIFWFQPTWTEKMQVVQVTPIIDNAAVLHHWLLYMKENGTNAPGSHAPDSGLQSADSALLSGWAPGNNSHVLPPDVGMYVVKGPSGRFGIELHYNTSSNPANRQDRSGAKLCLTKTPRPKEAATHWLGTQAIVSLFGGKFDAQGVCTVKQESHIIAMSPHMHKAGRYMKSIVTKKDGSKVTITDKPFAFDDQQIFPIDEIVVGPGDIINTTCSYDAPGPMTFGPGTDSEMCYNFITAWPVGSLSNGSAGLVGGKNTCIDGL